MSACLAVAFADRIEILSDTAMVRADNFAVEMIGSKIGMNPGLPLALFASGLLPNVVPPAQAVMQLSLQCSDGDDFLDQIPQFIRSLDATEYGSIYMAFNAPSSGLQLRFFDLTAAAEREPLVLSDNLEWAGYGPLDERGAGLVSTFQPDAMPLWDGIEQRGVAVMERYRHTPVDGRNYFGVGGQLQLCTVTSSTATIRTVGAWDDALGEPIEPRRPFRRFRA